MTFFEHRAGRREQNDLDAALERTGPSPRVNYTIPRHLLIDNRLKTKQIK